MTGRELASENAWTTERKPEDQSHLPQDPAPRPRPLLGSPVVPFSLFVGEFGVWGLIMTWLLGCQV